MALHCTTLRHFTSTSGRGGVALRALRFLEQQELHLPRAECDWMLGACGVAAAYYPSEISFRSIAMTTHLLSRWHSQTLPGHSDDCFPSECYGHNVSSLRRSVLDNFGAQYAYRGIYQISGVSQPQLNPTMSQHHHWLRRQFLFSDETAAMSSEQTTGFFKGIFGFCPIAGPLPAGNTACVMPGQRTRWAHGLIFARMTDDLELHHSKSHVSCYLLNTTNQYTRSPLIAHLFIHPSQLCSRLQRIPIPTFEQCLRWVIAALRIPPTPPPLITPGGRASIDFPWSGPHQHSDSSVLAATGGVPSSFFWSNCEHGKHLRQEELYLRCSQCAITVCSVLVQW
jgi:hypothetical protein